MAKITLVDDDENIVTSVSLALESHGHAVKAYFDGAAGLAALENEPPDLAILDVKMPGMDGLSAAREIDAEHLCAVLILTAFSQRDLIEQARDSGALAYLVKPFQKSELIPAIEVALGRFTEIRALEHEVHSLEDQMETRKVVDRAKGRLMDVHKYSEADAFSFIQKTAMRERVTMKQVAERLIDGSLVPPPPETSSDGSGSG
jgi:two-component system, response regulator PdtaR